jgi:hypothetical protein
MNKRNQGLRSGGQCVSCKIASRVDNTYCESCWFSDRAKKNAVDADALRALWEKQGRRCALTGAPIAPGPDMSVDHRMPVCRQGSSDIENLQWVTLAANHSKRGMTNEEFVALCRAVATTHGTTAV